MNHNYPHLADTEFPDLASTNVYKYENVYDYDKYKDTIKIKMMNVSWCGDYENTVYFETKELRDEWFREQKGLVRELSTMFRLYSDGTLKVDVPIDEAMDYNYAMIDYGKLPNQDELSDNHIMYYFISDMSQASVNATELTLSLDYWTTFINDMDITYVNLVRGHAPMAETTVEDYLSNPIENSEYLLTDDVSYGDFQRVSSTEPIVLNDENVVLGFLTNGDLSKDWTDQVAVTPFYVDSQALSAVDIWIINTDDFEGFRNAVDEQCPQFWTTVKGMFLIPLKLVNISTSYQFCGYTVHHVDTHSDRTIKTYDITKEKFGYPSNIADIAKLYTFPYAALEINDFKGSSTIVKVEDTSGSLELHTIMCDMYPFLNIEAYMLGLGGNQRSVVNFLNVYNNTMHIGGRFYDFSTKWSIPVFAVQLTVEDNWELHRKIQADANLDNVDTSNQLILDNTGVTNQATLDITSNNQEIERAVLYYNRHREQELGYAGKVLAWSMYDAEAEFGSAIVANNNAGTVAKQSTAITAGAINSLASGDGLMPNLLSAIPTAINTGIDVSLSSSNFQFTMGQSEAITRAQWGSRDAGFGQGYNYENYVYGTEFDGFKQNATQLAINGGSIQGYDITGRAAQTFSVEGSNNISIDAINANVANSISANSEIAQRNYNAALAQNNLSNPPQYGQLTGTPDIISKPFGYTYNIVTQSKNSIRQAAEQFLRYGYALNMQWNIGTYNLMPKFTYWKCDVVYCNDNGVFEGAQDMIKSILNRGTTVWKNPEEVGLVSIYKNI